MSPRLSIVVPFYNVEDYLGDCLDSLARQTFDDFEVILVDDGSCDSSGLIAKYYCERDNRFRLITQENQGLGPARNTGSQYAAGEYITFVDSDDLVSRHAYELMIQTLDETGSSFAAADARRFNNTGGVWESYVHKIPFARDRLATHVFEYHPLALDRMVWNKVFRRSFWKEFGYEFPAIRYEDYPVTLKAHIDAVTVDCLAVPAYYWRERESGESITQLKFEYSNLYDRVVSAEMVMDLVDKMAPELLEEVHRHLAQIDLAALLQAFGSVPQHEQDKLLQLGLRFARRLDSRVLGMASPFERLQYHALQAGDVDLLHRLAQFQLDGGLRGVRARRHPIMPWRFENRYPGLDDRPRSAPRKLYRLPRNSIDLYSSVTRVAWDDEALIVCGTAEIRHLVNDHKSELRIWLVRNAEKTPLRVQRFEARDSHGDQALVGFETRVPRSLLASFPPGEQQAHFVLEMRRGLIRRRSVLRNVLPGNPEYAPGDWVADDVWIQPCRAKKGRLVLRQIVRPFELTSASADGDAFVLSGRLPGEPACAELRLSRSSGAAALPIPIRTEARGATFVARLPFAAIVDAANPDDPFTQQTTRVPSLDFSGEDRCLLASGLDRSVYAIHEGRLLTLTRSHANYVRILEGPVRLTADAVDVESADGLLRLVVSGPWWNAPDGGTFVWRRFHENSNDYVDVRCRLAGDERRWLAWVDMSDLLPPLELTVRPSADPLASLTDWTLFAVPAGDAPPYAVQTDVFLLNRLPIEAQLGDRRLTLQPRVGRLHAEVH